MARLGVAHLRHIASLTRYRFTGGYWRETRFTWNTLFTSCSEYFSCSPLLCRSILISWICSRWLLSMLFMVSAAEGWLPFSFIGESSDGEDEGIDQGFGACPDLWIHGSKSTIMIHWFPTIILKSNFGLEKKVLKTFTKWYSLPANSQGSISREV